METILLHPPMLEGLEFQKLRQNPDRGWRLETYLTLGSNTVMFKVTAFETNAPKPCPCGGFSRLRPCRATARRRS